MSKRRKLGITVALAVACSAWFGGGCSESKMVLVQVRCVAIHYYGESPSKGTMSEQFTYMTAERTDTKERRNFPLILGKTNEVFVMDWNQRHYE